MEPSDRDVGSLDESCGVLDKALRSLGFVRVRKLPHTIWTDALGARGLMLPGDYLLFLNYAPPERLNLAFGFTLSGTQETLEGQIVEFVDYSSGPEGVLDSVARTPDGPHLPISVDAGGNYTYLSLAPGRSRVVDQDYGSGALSIVADSFTNFALSWRNSE